MDRSEDLRIEDVMTPIPLCVEDDCTLAGALSMLLREGYQSAPVIDGDGNLMGLLTRAGLLDWLSRGSGGDVGFQELMQSPVAPAVEQPLRVEAGAFVRELGRRLASDDASTALVVRDGNVVGIVTLQDIARAVSYGDKAPPRPAPGPGPSFTANGLPGSPANETPERELMALLLAQHP